MNRADCGNMSELASVHSLLLECAGAQVYQNVLTHSHQPPVCSPFDSVDDVSDQDVMLFPQCERLAVDHQEWRDNVERRTRRLDCRVNSRGGAWRVAVIIFRGERRRGRDRICPRVEGDAALERKGFCPCTQDLDLRASTSVSVRRS